MEAEHLVSPRCTLQRGSHAACPHYSIDVRYTQIWFLTSCSTEEQTIVRSFHHSCSKKSSHSQISPIVDSPSSTSLLVHSHNFADFHYSILLVTLHLITQYTYQIPHLSLGCAQLQSHSNALLQRRLVSKEYVSGTIWKLQCLSFTTREITY